jgi:putative toxin-antitoxin system antitoxin component (TIGR02293 family)
MAKTTKTGVAEIESLLGGPAVVYGRGTKDRELHTAVREGLPFRSFQHVAEALDLGAAELAGLIGVAPRTLGRRKVAKTLSAAESDRLVGLARIVWLAEETLGTKENVRGWLRHPNRAMGGVPPLSCLDTEPGRRLVEQTLLQIQYGIIS